MLIVIHLLMRIDTSIGKPLRHLTPYLLLGIARFLIDMYPINLLLNGRSNALEHVPDTWGQSAVFIPVICIIIVYIAGKSVRTYRKA